MIKISSLVLIAGLFTACAFAEEDTEENNCPMDIHPADLTAKEVSYDHFDKSLGEHIARFKNGDLLVVRYNNECDLGFDAAYFSQDGLNEASERKSTAVWLAGLFRNYKSLNTLIEKGLAGNESLGKKSFDISIPGEFGDEEHYFSLRDTMVSEDFISPLFVNVMSYSWLPPSGE